MEEHGDMIFNGVSDEFLTFWCMELLKRGYSVNITETIYPDTRIVQWHLYFKKESTL